MASLPLTSGLSPTRAAALAAGVAALAAPLPVFLVAGNLVVAGGFAQRSQVVVVTACLQTNEAGKTNLIKAHVLD